MLPDGDADCKLIGDKLLMAERVAAARPNGAIQIYKISEQIVACDNFEKPILPHARMQRLATFQHVGPSLLNAYLPPFCCRVDSFDEDKPVLPVSQPRRPHMKFENG